MMAATGHSAQMLEALRRFLPGRQAAPSGVMEDNSDTARLLEEKLVDARQKYSFFPELRLAEDAGRASGQRGAKETIIFVFRTDKSGDVARIELAISFAKKSFNAALGGVSATHPALARERLSDAEHRFAEWLAHELCQMVVPSGYTAILDTTIHPGQADQAEKTAGLNPFGFAAKTDQAETVVIIHLPVPQRPKNAALQNTASLASAASRMVVAPEVRLQLHAMSLSQMAGLKSGDVIKAGTENAEVTGQILVGGNAVFACELGQVGTRYSARVRAPITGTANPRLDELKGWVR